MHGLETGLQAEVRGLGIVPTSERGRPRPRVSFSEALASALSTQAKRKRTKSGSKSLSALLGGTAEPSARLPYLFGWMAFLG